MKKTLLLLAITILCIQVKGQEGWTLRQCIDYATAHNVNILQAEISVKKSEVQTSLLNLPLTISGVHP